MKILDNKIVMAKTTMIIIDNCNTINDIVIDDYNNNYITYNNHFCINNKFQKFCCELTNKNLILSQ